MMPLKQFPENAAVIDPSTLQRQIVDAFGAMPYPGNENIIVDNSGYHLECEDVRSVLAGHHWRDVTFDMLDELRSALPTLSPAGYRFYLPAFMDMSIVAYERADVLPDNVISSLTLPDDSDIDWLEAWGAMQSDLHLFSEEEWEQLRSTLTDPQHADWRMRTFAERVAGFDHAQCTVIRQFLEYMDEAHGEDFMHRSPRTAIERFWHLF